MTRFWLPLTLCAALWLVPRVAISAPAAGVACLDPMAPVLHDSRQVVGGALRPSIPIPEAGDTELLVQVVEEGIDVEASLPGPEGRIPRPVDNPVERQGVQRVIVRGGDKGPLQIRSVDHAGHRGSVRVVISRLAARESRGCLSYVRDLARADSVFASAQQASRSPERASSQEARVRFDAAANAYAQIASSAVRAIDTRVEAEASLAVAFINHHGLNNWSASARWSKAAASRFEKAQDPYMRARARSLLAAAWLESPGDGGSLEDASRVFQELARFHADRGEGYDEAMQSNYLGLSFYNQARFEEALPNLKRARDKFMALGENPRWGLAIQNIALCEWGLGHLKEAMGLFEEALRLMPADWRPRLYLNTLHNSGLINQSLGNLDESVRQHTRALNLAASLSNDYWRARSLMGLGLTYYSIGKRRHARELLQQAQEIMGPELDERGRVVVLRSLAVMEQEAGNFELADQNNEAALRLSRSPTGRDRIWLKFAETALARGDLPRAEQDIVAVTVALTGSDRLTLASARLLRAKLRRQQGDIEGAVRDLTAALPVFRTSQALVEEFEAQVELARAHFAARRIDVALGSVDGALLLGDELRTQTSNLEYRASVAASVRPALELKMDLLRARYEQLEEAGRRVEALAVAKQSLLFADSSRARAFEQYIDLRLDPARDAGLGKLLERRTQLYRELADRRYYLATRVDRAGPSDARARMLREEIAAKRAELGNLDTQIDSRSSRNQKADRVLDVEALLAASNQTPTRAAIEYWIGDTGYGWVIRSGKLSWITLGNGRDIANQARRLHGTLVDFARSPPRARIEALTQVNALIYEPLAAELRDATQLVIVPDGALHFVPFAALRDGRPAAQFLVQKASIALTPALRFYVASNATAPVAPSPRLLLVSDPIYQPDDTRLTDAEARQPAPARGDATLRDGEDIARLQRLRATGDEAAAVRKWFAAAQVEELSGRSATRDVFLALNLDQYQYIHVAAHGTLDGEIPQLSALTLGAIGGSGRVADQQVRVVDLLSRSFSARLVVLSACGTSLGPDYREEGPISLRYAMLARGARAVVSSLWPVMDETNARLMTEMYGRMLGSGERVDLALAGAMRALLGRSPAMDPAQWAPFTAYIAER